MKKILTLTVIGLFLFSSMGMAGEYGSNLRRNLWRGFKNIVGSPLEIPITVQEYHEGPGKPFIRHFGGALDGSGKMLLRAGSGLWDWLVAWIPDNQQGMLPDPETLF